MPPIKPPRFDAAEARQRVSRLRGRPAIAPPRHVSRSVVKLLKTRSKSHGPTLAEISERWNDIAGERLARLARPEKLTRMRDGATLTLRTAGPAATLLQAEAPRLIERANLYCGHGSVTRIAFRQGPLKLGADKPAKPAKKSVRGLTPREEDSLKESLGQVESDSLRDSLARLGRAILSRDV